MEQRAVRFGISDGSDGSFFNVIDSDEEERRKKRVERFGISTAEEGERRKRARLERFGTKQQLFGQASSMDGVGSDSWEAKIAARQLRFGCVGLRADII